LIEYLAFILGDIEVWDARRQPGGDNPCRRNNGNCSHLCLLSSEKPGYSCACPTGVKLIDKYTCANRSEQLLLIVQRTEICRISLDSPDYTNFVLPLAGIKHAIAIDFDPVEELLYWTDEQSTAIRRAPLDGLSQQNVISTEVASSNFIFFYNLIFALLLSGNIIYNKTITIDMSFNASQSLSNFLEIFFKI